MMNAASVTTLPVVMHSITVVSIDSTLSHHPYKEDKQLKEPSTVASGFYDSLQWTTMVN